MLIERRRGFRCDLGIRVHLFRNKDRGFQYAHLHDLSHTGFYLLTRQRLALNEKVELEIPAKSKKDVIKINARIVRLGKHRSWGLFSYGCRILHMNERLGVGPR